MLLSWSWSEQTPLGQHFLTQSFFWISFSYETFYSENIIVITTMEVQSHSKRFVYITLIKYLKEHHNIVLFQY